MDGGWAGRSSNGRDRLQASEVQQNFGVPDRRDFQSILARGNTKLPSDSKDFSVGLHESITLPGSGPQPCYQDGVPRWRLQPGKRCYAPVEFWPRTGEVHHATIHVSVYSSSSTISASFKVKGTSDYPPELQAAEEVRERHEAELKRIPHVASVEL